jgi:hypothetical protein
LTGSSATSVTDVKKTNAGGKAWTFQCMDFTDGQLKAETYAVKFQSVDEANRFHEVCVFFVYICAN